MLHTSDYRSEHSLDVAEDLTLTATRDILEAMAEAAGHPRRSLLALGYAGWGAGQLESEIKQNVWLTCDADESLIFGGDHDMKWTRALAKLGVDPSLLSSAARPGLRTSATRPSVSRFARSTSPALRWRILD